MKRGSRVVLTPESGHVWRERPKAERVMISIHMCAGVGWGHARVLSHSQRAREPLARAGNVYMALACGGIGRDTQRISHRTHVYEGARAHAS